MRENEVSEVKLERKQKINKFIANYTMIFILILLIILFGVLTGGNSLQPRNISNILRQMPITGVICLGMAICIITGNFDLSVGSVAGFTGALCAMAITKLGVNPVVSMLLSLLVGCLIGLLQGLLVAYSKIPSFIVTLGGMMIFEGAMLILTNNSSIVCMDETFMFIGDQYLSKTLTLIIGILVALALIYSIFSDIKMRKKNGMLLPKSSATILKTILVVLIVGVFIYLFNSFKGMPVSLFIMVICSIVIIVLMEKMRFGRKVYAVGGNSTASHMSGINVEKVILTAFIISGFFAALSGLLLSSKLGAAASTGGDGFEMDAIAACVIGGVSLVGGKGKISGAIIGALLMTILTNGMSLLCLELQAQNIAKGLVVIAAVWFDVGFSSKNR